MKMVQIGNVPEITEVKDRLDKLKKTGLIKDWELPYENLLTRKDAAIFFFDLGNDINLEEIKRELSEDLYFECKRNEQKVLSCLEFRFGFAGNGI